MKNKIIKIIICISVYLLTLGVSNSSEFIFDITEVEITENGNKFNGYKRGVIKTDDGVIINADQFEYIKDLNILNASGKVEILDPINNFSIYTDKVTYKKKEEIIFTKNKSKAISLNDEITIIASEFIYNRNLNILNAKENVTIEDKIQDYVINSNTIEYLRDEEKIFSKGKTSAIIKSKYNFNSKDVLLLRNSKELSSKEKTTISSSVNLYHLTNFKYSMDKEYLKGEDIMISSNYNLPKNDKFFFKSGIINLNTRDFIAKDTEIEIHKDIFDNSENDPRLKGLSSNKTGNITVINKGVFTSCKKSDSCPPWAIQASEIKYDKNKKQIDYKNAILKVYDVPILYFPKFFHPDPTVKRQTGLLKPLLNYSNVLGSSVTLPYYFALSVDSDLTTAPTFFEKDTNMIQNEYRKVGKDYNIVTNFGHTRGYKSTLLNKKKNITYLFAKLNYDLGLDGFNSSKLYFDLEKVSDDTFLKIFDSNLISNSTSLKPEDSNKLSSELKIDLEHSEYNFTGGLQLFEDLQKNNSDRYQYVLPYYDFNKNLIPDLKNGSINFNSTGSNNLDNTNELKSKVINNLSYSSLDYYFNNGIRSNLNINLKNLNSLGKNISNYKSSPQVKLSSIFEINSSLPLKKEDKNYVNYLTPQISLRVNPSDMKNFNTTERTINTDNIFEIDRLGLEDSFEAGRSLTIGIDYKKEMLEDMNHYFQAKLATVIRDKEENFMPKKTTLNKKNSNIFGSISNNFSKDFNLNYNFALDNSLSKFEYNDVTATLRYNNFSTAVIYTKEMGEMGDQNLLTNKASYKFNEENNLTFNTRRNRKLNLTEYYDLVYEYKNDCITAGIKYKKTYYEDRDLKPTEDLLFTLTLFPLTTFEQKIDQ